MKKVGDKLYELRIEHNLSQEQLGDKIGVTRQTVSLWEANKRQINAEKLKSICDIFNIASDYFLADESEEVDLDSTNDNSDVALCAEIEEEGKVEVVLTEDDREIKNRKHSARYILLAVIFAIISLIGILCFVISKLMIPPEQGFETNTGRTYNFDLEILSWIILGIAILVAIVAIVLVILIKYKRKNNKTKK